MTEVGLSKKISHAKNLHVFLLFFLLAITTYFGVVNGPFIWDDRGLIVGNEFIKSFTHVKDWFTTGSLTGLGIENSNFYRPIELLLHSVTYSIFELWEAPYHILNILIHTANSFFVYILFGRLKFTKTLSLAAGTAFLLHPVNTEAVSYISSLPDLLAPFFVLLTILTATSVKLNGAKKYVPLALLTILALLSKETAVVLPLLAILIPTKSAKKKSLFIICALTATYVLLRLTVLNFTGTFILNTADNLYTSHLWVRIITFVSILPEYIKLIFAPIELFFEKPFPIYTTLLTPNGGFGMLILLIGSLLSAASFKRDKIFFIGFFWFLIPLLPVAGIIPGNAVFAERWLYLPLIGILLIVFKVASIFLTHNKNQKIQIPFVIIFLLTCVLFGTKIVHRNTQWANPKAFYKNEIAHNSLSPRLYNQIGRLYLETNDLPNAITYLSKGMELDQKGTHFLLRYRLGDAYYKSGDPNRAAAMYFETLKLNPNYLPAHKRLEDILRQSGYKEHADTFLELMEKIKNGQSLNYSEIQILKYK